MLCPAQMLGVASALNVAFAYVVPRFSAAESAEASAIADRFCVVVALVPAAFQAAELFCHSWARQSPDWRFLFCVSLRSVRRFLAEGGRRALELAYIPSRFSAAKTA
jgi:hypothetical protein